MFAATTNASALQAAGIIGTWRTDVPAGLSRLDEGAATLLAGNRDLAGKPIPLDVALARIHPDDRDCVFARIHTVRRTGGLIGIEFRVLTETDETRWILCRGCLIPDRNGAMRGYGAYIDMTEFHEGPPVASGDEDPLAVAADHCMKAHAALQKSGDTYLTTLMNALLFAIGCVLAQKTRG